MTPEIKQEMAEKIMAVCQNLGWRADPPTDAWSHVHIKAYIQGFPCASASLAYGRYPDEGRITITGYTDHDSSIYRYDEKHVGIGVAATRPTNQIIKEIQRRFLPAFIEIATKAEEIQKRRDQHNERLRTCLSRLKGESLDEYERNRGEFQLHLDSIWGTVHYAGDDQLNLDLHSIPIEQAERILAILRPAAQEVSHGA